ncbi:hypothetical protein GWI33_017150 [Rhynchophorus ferrugineus]|uniref:Uncharacterized protein n=1 Tax=Rhynchophorus ferrugineus TaxID=354439 RepID=A0A834HWJ1_RHYFE|nr:hypothetical protein GWI33_017150 [Rhynchophorus ferrugineus]
MHQQLINWSGRGNRLRPTWSSLIAKQNKAISHSVPENPPSKDAERSRLLTTSESGRKRSPHGESGVQLSKRNNLAPYRASLCTSSVATSRLSFSPDLIASYAPGNARLFRSRPGIRRKFCADIG